MEKLTYCAPLNTCELCGRLDEEVVLFLDGKKGQAQVLQWATLK